MGAQYFLLQRQPLLLLQLDLEYDHVEKSVPLRHELARRAQGQHLAVDNKEMAVKRMFWPVTSNLASWLPTGRMIPDVGVACSRMKYWPRALSWDRGMDFSASELPAPEMIRESRIRSAWTHYGYSITASRIRGETPSTTHPLKTGGFAHP